MSERYAAFISYSHSDEGVARWLHRAIEGFRFPKGLRGEASEFGPVPSRLPPVFRDRDELPASGDLGSELRAALAASRFQIVLCSPRAAQSKWVNEEILAFKRTHGEHRTLAVIVEGEPYSGGAEECFPEALRFKLAADGSLSGEPAEPIAADIRKGKDGKRLALLKLLAGISGTRLDQLVRRDAARRQRRLAFVAAGSSVVALTTIGLAIYAEGQRRVAVEQRDMAEASLAFLTGTFEIANPATENPKTITALTILDRASKRAAKEFADRPEIAASLLRTTGGIYYNLGLNTRSEEDFLAALQFEPQNSRSRTLTLLGLVDVAKRKQNAAEGKKYLIEASNSNNNAPDTTGEIDARLLESRGNIAFLKGDYSRSARYFDVAIGKFRTMRGDQRKDIARNLANKARSLDLSGDLRGSSGSYREAREIVRTLYGPEDVRTAEAQNNEALALFNEGRLVEANEIQSHAVYALQRVLEPNHPSIASAHLLLARIEAARGQYSRARREFDESRKIGRSIYDLDHPLLGDLDFFQAEMEKEAGNFSAALTLTVSAKRVYDAAYGPLDPDQAELLLLRSRIFSSSGERLSALAACVAALRLQRELSLSSEITTATAAHCEKLKES